MSLAHECEMKGQTERHSKNVLFNSTGRALKIPADSIFCARLVLFFGATGKVTASQKH